MGLMELKERIKAKTPIWFKQIRKAGLTIAAVGTALISAEATIPGFTLPAILHTFCTYCVVAGVTAGVVSTTAKKD